MERAGLSTDRPGSAAAPTFGAAPAPAYRISGAPAERMPEPVRRRLWTLPRFLIIIGYGTVWLAFAYAAQFDARVLFSDPFDLALLLAGLIFNVWLAIEAKPWLFLAAAITGSLLPLLFLVIFGGIVRLAEPSASREFVSLALLAVALLLAMPAGIVGFLIARRPIRGVRLQPGDSNRNQGE